MTEPYIPSASGQASYMAEFPTRYPLSPSHRGAGTGIRTHSIVTVYPAYTFRSDTTAPRGQPLISIRLGGGTFGFVRAKKIPNSNKSIIQLLGINIAKHLSSA